MKLIVGLGNPGKQYNNTRHNIGFKCIDEIARFFNVSYTKEKFGGLYAEVKYQEKKVILLKPQKYMNLSGEVIIAFVNYFKIKKEDILIIYDDMDIDIGKIKIKGQGSSGGHNGLKNIEHYLKTNEYKRIKVGVSRDLIIDSKDYVLGKFTKEELRIIEQITKKIPNIIIDYLNISFSNLMNKYNA